MHDLVITGGLVVDGTGAEPRRVDVAVDGGVITDVGADVGAAAKKLDADGLLVCPGWVDVHTHYDGQATWDNELGPSSWHGVTTAVFGNCAVGFAPVRQGTSDFLINLMEGVEDIPGSVLAEGVSFEWETFEEYLDALAARPRTLDVAAQVPHGALRFYVMGERGADHQEIATASEIEQMADLVASAVRAGAVGFSTSRKANHRARDGRPTPSWTAADAELLGIVSGLAREGRGVIQANSDFNDDREFELLRELGERSGRPVSFTLVQVDHAPERWRALHQATVQANDDGVAMIAQVSSRAIGVIVGLEATVHPFSGVPAFEEIANLPPRELVAAMLVPERKAAILAGATDERSALLARRALDTMYELGDPVNYEPAPETSVGARARREGRDPLELAFDLLVADDGRSLLYVPFENYSYGSLDVVREMLLAPHTVSALSDGGAHVGTVCDASFPTFLLSHWVKGRSRGEGLPLEFVVAKQTSQTARLFGLSDRGAILPGLRADMNLIDLDGLELRPPALVADLPAGGRRLIQRANGYVHTICAGIETYRNGVATGETPGRLVRSGGG